MVGSLSQLEVAIATMHRTEPHALVERLGLTQANCGVLVINQVPEGALPPNVDDGRVRMLSFPERGIALSRNRALQHARSDVLLLADDDIRCLPEAFPALMTAFRRHPRAAAVTGRFRDSDTGRLARRYPSSPGRHTALSVASVMSVEVAVAPARLGGVRFDPRFGLGARYPSGEEAIFLRDLQRAGHPVRYAPLTLCEHPGHGSGHLPWDATTTRAKGAVLRRMYPQLWPALVGYLAATKYAQHGRQLGRVGFAAEMLRGAQELALAPPG